ncbi:hypothetical protein AB0470_04445 [Streptomyces griseosporeus]|uniref:Tetratricopeptide repeat protein n=2 Tax=Streptomyces TaxID=1883 RepID=A0ABV3KHK7_STRGS
MEEIGPRTVVWLNESQHYLLTPDSFLGEKVAAGLRQLLRNPDVAPVLILGTLWPEYWDAITAPPKFGEIERHSQASALIRNSVVSVPDSFTDSEIDHLKDLDDLDPRIKSALNRATDGCLTQYLAGGPALLERYHNSPPLVRALVHAAIDCRRFGHSPAVPLSLLEEVAHSYVSDRHWDEAADDWLERSLAYAAAPCRGARGVLTRIRPRPSGHELKGPHYILSDFIEQYLRRSRRELAPPTELWQAFLHHAQPRELEKLASSADSVGLTQVACQMALAVHLAGCAYSWKLPTILENAGYGEKAFELYEQAAERGDVVSMAELAMRLHRQEEHDAALTWERKASVEGHLKSLWSAVDFLMSQDRSDEAVLLCRECADLGHHGALEVGAYVLQENEQVDEAIAWYSEAMVKGEEAAPYYAGELLSKSGQLDRAREWYLLSSDSSQDTRAMRRIAEDYERNGQLDQALEWRRRAAKVPGADVLWGHVIDLALTMDASGRTAIALLEKEKEDGDEDASHWLGVLHEKLGNTDDAVEYYLESREWGHGNGYARIARMLENVGEYDRALFYYQAGYEEVDIESLELGCELLHRTEGIESVLEWLEDITDRESFPALLASSFLEKEGRVDEALAWHKRAAESGDSESLVWGAEVLARAGRIDECIQWCWRAASAGESLAKKDLERILRENGEEEIADHFARYGWDPDGSISKGWRLQ